MPSNTTFFATGRGNAVFTCYGDYGAMGLTYPTLGHDTPNKQSIIHSVLTSITNDLNLLDEPCWIDKFFSQLYFEFNKGRFSEVDRIGFSLTVLEPMAGGVRIGTLGIHYVCMKWPESGIGRLMHSDSIMEHPEIPRSAATDMWDITTQHFQSGSTMFSLNWRDQILTDGTAVIVVAPYERIEDLKKLETQNKLYNVSLESICKEMTKETESMCLIAER